MGVEEAKLKKLSTVPLYRLTLSWSMVTDDVLNHQYHGNGTTEDPYRVEWLDNDPRNPLLFPSWIKWLITFLLSVATLSTSFSSSALSGAAPQIMADFNSSKELTIADTSLFVLAFAIGPAIWAPLSELYGRQSIFTLTFMMTTLFSGAIIASQNITAILVLRFFAGAFGSSVLANGGGVISDIFTARERGLAAVVYLSVPFLGPSIGGIVAGFLSDAAGWRWLEGLIAILNGIAFIVGLLLVPETYAPFLLQRRAAKLSKMTGKVYKSGLEIENGHKTTGQIFRATIVRPLVLLFREPIVVSLSVYMAIIYGTVYLEFAAFPIVFEEKRGWTQGVSGLPFIGVMMGQIFGAIFAIFDDVRYRKVVDASSTGRAPPEARLIPSMIGCFMLPLGLFWFAWTNYVSIHWIVCILATVPFGFSHVTIFLSIAQYLIDSYTVYAASALAANAILRALFGAAFPLFTTPMYNSLGIHWASSIPGFLALICMPFPFLFYRYGPQIRARGKYSGKATRILEAMIAQTAGANTEQGSATIPEDVEATQSRKEAF